MKLLDPEGGFIMQWNNFFCLCSVMALSLDPLFLYVPVVNGTQKCIDMDHNLAIVLSVIRSFADILYVVHIIIMFRTACVPIDNHTLGQRITEKSYLTSYFIVDVFSALPLPQLAVLVIIPNLDGPTSFSKETLLKLIIFTQYVPRVIQTSLFYQKVKKTSGFLIEKAWTGIAFNFFLYLLASYVFGALWYLFAIESALRCWHTACRRHNYHFEYLYCGTGRIGDFGFLNTSCPLLERNEIKHSTNFDFGIFLDALQTNILETRDFRQKILYCSLWGLQNLSSLGQGLKASPFYGEALFAYFTVITGLVLYVLLFGNMQIYLQSTSNQSRRMESTSNQSRRVEEMKEKRRDAEDAMSHMSLPEDLRQRVRTDPKYTLNITRGIDSDSFVRDLSPDLRKDIKRHLCLTLLKKVPTFGKMDGRLLDAICDHLKRVPYTENSYLVREGDPVREMLFIKRGEVQSSITNGGSVDFYNASSLNFCGEELLTWALDPKVQLPFSTRTVKALTNVEAFTLLSGELLQVVSQFRLSHSGRFKHTFRFYSQQWRTWAAGYIQSAWRRNCKRRHEKEVNKRLQDALASCNGTSTLSFGASIYVSLFFSVLRISRRKRRSQICNAHDSAPKPEFKLQKPTQPKFDADMAAPKLEHMLPLRVLF